MRAHDLSPHAVFASDPPPWRDSLYPPRPGGAHFLGTTVAELLAEPSPRASTWLAAVYARLVVASTGPVAVGGAADSPAAQRLERARWLRVAPDSDVGGARNAAWPALGPVRDLALGVGSLAPDLVIVAERDPYDRLPMFARSGVWLFRALRHLGYDELTVYVTNALDRDQRAQGPALERLRDAFAAYDPTWMALGAIPHEVLTTAGIEHVASEHPSHARRFEFAAGPEGYAEKLVTAGVPRREGAIHVLAGPPLLVERLGLPRTPSPPTGTNTSRAKKLVPTPVLDKARMAFVLGEANTLKEAAAKASDSKSERAAILKLAREQGWETERERYYAQKREATKSSASEAEAKRIGESRALAWKVAHKMLERLDDQLNSAESPGVFAKDVKAVTEVALALSEKGDASFDDEKKRLANLAPEAFAAELRRTLGAFGVEETVPPAAPPAAPPAS